MTRDKSRKEKIKAQKRKEGKNIIEFRFPNATDEEIIWQNNINTTTKMGLSSKARVIDEEFLDYKLKHFTPDVNNNLIYKKYI